MSWAEGEYSIRRCPLPDGRKASSRTTKPLEGEEGTFQHHLFEPKPSRSVGSNAEIRTHRTLSG